MSVGVGVSEGVKTLCGSKIYWGPGEEEWMGSAHTSKKIEGVGVCPPQEDGCECQENKYSCIRDY